MSKRMDPIAIFDDAVRRLEQGESLEQVLARYPEHEHELKSMLAVVQLLQQEGAAELERSPERRARSRQRFMAAVMRAQQAPPNRSPSSDGVSRWRPPNAPANNAGQAGPTRALETLTLGKRLRQLGRGVFTQLVATRAVKVAAVLLLLFGVSMGGLIILAQGAVPGEPAYSVKELYRGVQLALASEDEREELERELERRRVEEQETARERGNEFPFDITGVVSSIGQGVLHLQVPGHPTTIRIGLAPVRLQGELTVGARVEISGRSVNHEFVAEQIRVLAPPPPTPTPTPTVTHTPTPRIITPVRRTPVYVAPRVLPTATPTWIPTATPISTDTPTPESVATTPVAATPTFTPDAPVDETELTLTAVRVTSQIDANTWQVLHESGRSLTIVRVAGSVVDESEGVLQPGAYVSGSVRSIPDVPHRFEIISLRVVQEPAPATDTPEPDDAEPTSTPTATPVLAPPPTPTPSLTPEATATTEATPEAVAPTATNTPTAPGPTLTPAPDEPTATPTSAPPTSTPMHTPPPTPTPTVAPPTATATAALPTPTATMVLQLPTPEPTDTPQPEEEVAPTATSPPLTVPTPTPTAAASARLDSGGFFIPSLWMLDLLCQWQRWCHEAGIDKHAVAESIPDCFFGCPSVYSVRNTLT